MRRRLSPAGKVAQPAQISSSDIAVKTAWRLTLTEWNNLTDKERADKRDRVAEATATKGPQHD